MYEKKNGSARLIDELEEEGYLHPPFGEAYLPFFERLCRAFNGITHHTPEGWQAYFRGVPDPLRVMAYWKRFADFYEHFTQGRKYRLAKKKEIYGLVFVCITYGPSMALDGRPRYLSRPQVERIVGHIAEALGGRNFHGYWDER